MSLCEGDATAGQPCDVRCLCLRVPADAFHVVVQVVADNEDDIGAFGSTSPAVSDTERNAQRADLPPERSPPLRREGSCSTLSRICVAIVVPLARSSPPHSRPASGKRATHNPAGCRRGSHSITTKDPGVKRADRTSPPAPQAPWQYAQDAPRPGAGRGTPTRVFADRPGQCW